MEESLIPKVDLKIFLWKKEVYKAFTWKFNKGSKFIKFTDLIYLISSLNGS